MKAAVISFNYETFRERSLLQMAILRLFFVYFSFQTTSEHLKFIPGIRTHNHSNIILLP